MLRVFYLIILSSKRSQLFNLMCSRLFLLRLKIIRNIANKLLARV
jgi:hypothetical protein